MKLIAFELSMPNAGSWNGKWTGEGNCYARVRKFTKKDDDKINKILDEKSFYYSWSDGWGAKVSVRQVSSKEANKLRKNTRGFYGYDWMIDSIIDRGYISTDK